MARFFLTGGSTISGGTAFILGEDAAHARVLRLRVGDRLVVCDGGQDHLCTVKKIAPEEVEAEIVEVTPCRGEPDVRVVILCGLPKGDKAEYIVQKCTEAGAAEIVFFQSHRCVAKFPSDPEKKTARWQRIAEEAAKQSGRGIVPEVRAVEDFGQMLELGVKQELKLFLYEAGERTPILSAVAEKPEAKSCAVVTGPEGGFENHEVELARRLGFTICSMGPRILRCETAPVVALTAVLCGTGNL